MMNGEQGRTTSPDNPRDDDEDNAAYLVARHALKPMIAEAERLRADLNAAHMMLADAREKLAEREATLRQIADIASAGIDDSASDTDFKRFADIYSLSRKIDDVSGESSEIP